LLAWQEEAAPVLKQMRLHKRGPLPGHEQEVMSRRPPHSEAAAICAEAIRDLSTERPLAIASGMNGTTFWTRTVYGAIPWSAVERWCQRHGLDDDNAGLVWSVVQHHEAQRIEGETSARRLNGGS